MLHERDFVTNAKQRETYQIEVFPVFSLTSADPGGQTDPFAFAIDPAEDGESADRP